MYGEVKFYGGEESVNLSVNEIMYYELDMKPEEQEGMGVQELFERKSDEAPTS